MQTKQYLFMKANNFAWCAGQSKCLLNDQENYFSARTFFYLAMKTIFLPTAEKIISLVKTFDYVRKSIFFGRDRKMVHVRRIKKYPALKSIHDHRASIYLHYMLLCEWEHRNL